MPEAPPDEPKRSLFERLGAALPVGLTALATILAGLSTGELSRAMYWRSAAAQDQAKANDQWSLASHKRDRALVCETTAATLKAVGGYKMQPRFAGTVTPDVVQQVVKWLNNEGHPPADDAAVRDVLEAVYEKQPEGEVLVLARKVKAATLDADILTAEKRAKEVEKAFVDELEQARVWAIALNGEEKAERAAYGYEVNSRRYKAEATANQWVGFLYEVRVKTSTAESERFRQRSENFFFAMLAAQVGGVGSSLALARKRRSALWLVAGVGGLAAVGFGAFVYLTM